MRRRTLVIMLVLALAVGLAAVAGVVNFSASGPAVAASTNAAPAAGVTTYDTMAAISDGLGRRVAGSAGERAAGDYVGQQLTDYGYSVTTQEFNIGKGKSSRNIIAVKQGSNDARIVVGAHYDSVPRVGRGAFDNASGVALMLELARHLQAEDTPYTLVFVGFGAEEIGLKGSRHFVRSMTQEERDATFLMINFDSVAGGDTVNAYSPAKVRWPQLTLRQIARSQGGTIITSPAFNKDYPYGTTGDWSDHVAFLKAGIPYLYIEATNWLLGDKDGYINTKKDGEIWHTKKDTIAFIEQRYPGRMQAQLETEFQALYQFLLTELPEAGPQ